MLKTIYKEFGPDKGTNNDVLNLKLSQGFGYCTLLGEMMYAYVTCRPGIGYAITIMNKSLPSHLNSIMNFSKEL